jgi:hypothetical protein
MLSNTIILRRIVVYMDIPKHMKNGMEVEMKKGRNSGRKELDIRSNTRNIQIVDAIC